MTSNDTDVRKETTLSPEVRRIRNSIIKKFADEPLEIMAKFVKDIVDSEEDTVKRLGAMAARVEILRMRISQISKTGMASDLRNETEETVEEDISEEQPSNIVITSPNLSDWVRLRIIENSEINGVRFPKGVVIDVSQEDGDRLLDSGKASYVDEDEIEDIKSEVSSRTKSVLKDKTSKIILESDELDVEELKNERASSGDNLKKENGSSSTVTEQNEIAEPNNEPLEISLTEKNEEGDQSVESQSHDKLENELSGETAIKPNKESWNENDKIVSPDETFEELTANTQEEAITDKKTEELVDNSINPKEDIEEGAQVEKPTVDELLSGFDTEPSQK